MIPVDAKLARTRALDRKHIVKIVEATRVLLITCSLGSLVGCGMTRSVDRQLDVQAERLAIDNVTISRERQPKAEITPQGNFLIARHEVALTPLQHAEMLACRGQLVDIGEQALAVGKWGVAVGMRASFPMTLGALFGESDDKLEQRMNERLADVHADAAKICDSLPAVMESEQRLAASVPEFRPYANLSPARIEQCREEALKDGKIELSSADRKSDPSE